MRNRKMNASPCKIIAIIKKSCFLCPSRMRRVNAGITRGENDSRVECGSLLHYIRITGLIGVDLL
jgi:hypothetical protein